ncbi:SigB/SigF/SigG family RNA polymerase sigma factor [Anaerotignum sp. MB30-C6]|uniref:SigB/SigF/SigG family RNA polymerase sigma factor n=1 Tax=Anaerotignum sp. MB30-C6 TaxID=3070814 RepID=UPI0027DAC173|nr:SigB/SigF/SigG family RNA polymerase sigma factor [Anaerotignum sp. MB30-C6]WMI82316.1 SigB/SigF/SigG family RNA polymerase sigma factor [Anaerotignum sp. MB30-C6]
MDRTQELIRQAKQGDQQAKEILLQENSGLVWSVVRRFQGRGVEMEDLYQIGAIGLLKCIEKFDFSFEVKFSTYAVPMIIGEIRRFLRDDGTIKVSRSLKELAAKAKKMQEKLQQEANREVTLLELAAALEVEVEQLIPALESKREVESLNAPISQQEDLQVQDKLAAKEDGEQVINRLCLMEALDSLEVKERQIIVLRYFEDRTQTEVAKRMGISQVQVSRIEKKVLERMRKRLSSE